MLRTGGWLCGPPLQCCHWPCTSLSFHWNGQCNLAAGPGDIEVEQTWNITQTTLPLPHGGRATGWSTTNCAQCTRQGRQSGWMRPGLSTHLDDNEETKHLLTPKNMRDFCGNSFHPGALQAAFGDTTQIKRWINEEPNSIREGLCPVPDPKAVQKGAPYVFPSGFSWSRKGAEHSQRFQISEGAIRKWPTDQGHSLHLLLIHDITSFRRIWHKNLKAASFFTPVIFLYIARWSVSKHAAQPGPGTCCTNVFNDAVFFAKKNARMQHRITVLFQFACCGFATLWIFMVLNCSNWKKVGRTYLKTCWRRSEILGSWEGVRRVANL